MRPWGWWSVTTPGVAVTNARFSVQGVAAEQGVKRCGRSVPTPGQAEQASRLRFILMNVFIMTVMALFFFFFLSLKAHSDEVRSTTLEKNPTCFQCH